MNELMSDDKISETGDKIQDTINFLGEDDELQGKDNKREEKEKEDIGDEQEDKEAEDGDEEKEEIKLVEEDEDEEKAEDEVLAIPVKKSVILAKYPNLFKDFPILEKTYYTHQKYAEIFPTPEDAIEAQEKIESYTRLEEDLVEKGDLTAVLAAVKETNPDAFHKIADDYFEMLGKVDPQAQFHVVSGLMKGLITNLVKTGRAQGKDGEPLIETAHILNQYLFNSNEFEPQKRLSRQSSDNDEAKKLKEERQKFVNEKYDNARTGLNNKVSNILKSTIAANIDPKGGMSDYVKKNAVNDALNDISSSIREDKIFVKHLDKLWENAFKNDFNSNSLDQIRKAILAKAKALLPGTLKKVRSEAIRGLDKSRKETTDRKGPLSPGRSSSESSSRGKNTDIKGMKTLDALNALMDD